jgi:methylmalonyl-CoA/ethylmalonyl-CoA epimerase
MSYSLSLSRVGQVAVPVSNLDRAVTFYQETLGMQFLFQVPGMAFFDCGGVRLLLTLPEGSGQAEPGSVIYYNVDDIGAAYSVLIERGVGTIREPHPIAEMPDHDLWMAFFNDSEGNTLALMSEVPRT